MKAFVAMSVFCITACSAWAEKTSGDHAYIEISRQIVDCVEEMNKQLDDVGGERSAEDIASSFEQLSTSYRALAGRLQAMDPPSDPALMKEYGEVQSRMVHAVRQFMQKRATLTQAKTLDARLTSILNALIRPN